MSRSLPSPGHSPGPSPGNSPPRFLQGRPHAARHPHKRGHYLERYQTWLTGIARNLVPYLPRQNTHLICILKGDKMTQTPHGLPPKRTAPCAGSGRWRRGWPAHCRRGIAPRACFPGRLPCARPSLADSKCRDDIPFRHHASFVWIRSGSAALRPSLPPAPPV